MIEKRVPLAAAKPTSLTVLVPALNEEQNIGPTIERLLRALNITIEDYEVIVVNDGSTDRTGEKADALATANPAIRVIHNARRSGLGHAYVQGVAAARKEFFVYVPGDNTWPLRSFVELFGTLGKADIVTSYSTNPGVRPAGRRMISRAYTLTLNLLFGYRMHYYNGLTIYPTAFLRTHPISTYGFGFQAEALLKALYRGFSYIEVALPIDERTAGGSKAVGIRNIASVAGTVLRLFWNLRIVSVEKTTDFPQSEDSEPLARRSSGSVLNIVVVGASSGIGANLVRTFRADGHRVFACARNEAKLRELTNDGKSGYFRACDVTSESDVHALVEAVEREMQHLDVLINCAGGFGAIGPLEHTASDEWLRTITVNLYGPYLTVKHFLPLLSRSAAPRVLNFSGGGAFGPFPNYSAYACSKAAIVRFTECMATEFAARGIAVNAIAPGLLPTPAHEATLSAGEERAGALQYRRTRAMLQEGGASMKNLIECVKALLSPELHGLTGKTISVNFDPWRTAAFRDHVRDITRSDLYAMRRINIVNLPDGRMRADLSEAWASHGTEL